MKEIVTPAWIYRQCDADYTRSVPGEGYTGWTGIEVRLPLERTAIVSMHAWGGSLIGQFPGWDRCVEYRSRSFAIMQTAFPKLFGAARGAGLPIIHVVGGGPYYQHRSGFAKTQALMARQPATAAVPAGAPPDPVIDELRALKSRQAFPGEQNQADVTAGFKTLDFGCGAEPADDEYIAEDAAHLNVVARHLGVSHLIYIGFAINWCLLMSPGGMLDMSRLGYFCSAIRQAVSAVENRESAAAERHKEEGLWRTALNFGLVFDLEPLLRGIEIEHRRERKQV